MLFFIKVVVGGFLIAIVSEISKRSETMAALIISLPIISIITYTFIYLEQRNLKKIADMSSDMIWLLIPSAAFFIMLPILLGKLENFWLSVFVAAVITSIFYYAMMKFLGSTN